MTAELWTCHLGTLDYAEAFDLQLRLRAARQAEEVPDLLLLLEHPPIYTRGRRSEPGELPLGEDWYRAQGIDVVSTDRGGKVTYHAPGQLVGYPIMRIDDVPAYLAAMEGALVAALAEEGLAARGRSTEARELSGVWVGERKIASIGLHISRRVTMHGFALNVDNDLRPFEWVVPCGLAGVRMTSLAAETGREGRLPCFRREVAYAFARAFGRRQRLISAHRLGRLAPLPLSA